MIIFMGLRKESLLYILVYYVYKVTLLTKKIEFDIIM